jgi:hypothetical protein
MIDDPALTPREPGRRWNALLRGHCEHHSPEDEHLDEGIANTLAFQANEISRVLAGLFECCKFVYY